jgi:hypothetical protein
MQAAARKLSTADTTLYPVDDDMGESLHHRDIAELLRLLLQRFLSLTSRVARVGANQFIYWRHRAARRRDIPLRGRGRGGTRGGRDGARGHRARCTACRGGGARTAAPASRVAHAREARKELTGGW